LFLISKTLEFNMIDQNKLVAISGSEIAGTATECMGVVGVQKDPQTTWAVIVPTASHESAQEISDMLSSEHGLPARVISSTRLKPVMPAPLTPAEIDELNAEENEA